MRPRFVPPPESIAAFGSARALTYPRPRIAWQIAKRSFDCIAASLLLALTSPILIASLCLVKFTSPGPAIYSQRRIGWRGNLFTIYKVRSMCIDAELRGGPRWCVPGDARVTAVGRLLRKLHIDELPQLWNVLTGEMSLVGPRPERPEFMPKIRPFVPGYDARHAVRPGITGLAQVQVDADTEVSNVSRKLRYDLHYIRNQGPLLETQIYACTLLKICGMSLPRLRALLALGLDDDTRSIQRAA